MSGFTQWAMGIVTAVFPGLIGPEITVYNGYIEGDYVYVAPAAAGRIAELSVAEGEVILAGAALFRIENAHQIAGLRAAEAQVVVAQANLDNLATGSRTAEIDVIRATLDQARADQQLAASTVERTQRLLEGGSVAVARFDTDMAKLESANARIAQLEAQLQVAILPARDAQRIAAEATLETALALRDDARLALADRSIIAPIAGQIDRVFYDTGEVAGAGAPVVSILPPGALKALFFVPESDRATVQPGDIFAVECNGCAPDVQARVTRLASTPQFTPPIIYSREERSRLVFRTEAVLLNADGLLPGQPLTLSPLE